MQTHDDQAITAALETPAANWSTAKSVIDALLYNQRRYLALNLRRNNIRAAGTVNITDMADIDARMKQVRADHRTLLIQFQTACNDIATHLEGLTEQ